ncbi:LysR substrate-binding domain-containing protein [Vibrio sp. S4M6]|uniref:LysR substrate-binding domain-containing protein n=1 Tax=Vibrio sinus TaxID=2946865 RepID=UPI00202A6DCA|nr:LysR substrate-binding domain-containing protein [Vibrio sinus]MCL9782494.1 LysR substrate-binding domain-containing protein [Vibrio sinus]
MVDVNDMLVFAKVVEKGSFTAAADALGTPKSNISRKITRLEQEVGVRLLERSTRSQRLTEIGRQFYDSCRRIKDELEVAQHTVESLMEKPVGTLKVCTSVTIGQSLLPSILSGFCCKYPDIKLELSLTNRRVDVIEEGFDIVFRVGKLVDSGLISKKLSTLNLRLYASPIYATKEINIPTDLLKCPLMLMNDKERKPIWNFVSGDLRQQIHFTPHIQCDDFSVLKRMAMQGVGVTELPEYMAEEFVKQGKLIHILPKWQFESVSLYALYPSRRGATPKLRALLEYLAEHLPKNN